MEALGGSVRPRSLSPVPGCAVTFASTLRCLHAPVWETCSRGSCIASNAGMERKPCTPSPQLFLPPVLVMIIAVERKGAVAQTARGNVGLIFSSTVSKLSLLFFSFICELACKVMGFTVTLSYVYHNTWF